MHQDVSKQTRQPSTGRRTPPDERKNAFYHPPQLTLTSRLLADAAEGASRLPRVVVWAAVLSSLASILCVDILTQTNANLLLLYVALAAIMSWCCGEISGFVLVLLAVAASASVRHWQILHIPGQGIAPLTEIWNIFARAATLAFVVVIVNGMRTAMMRERWQSSVDSLTGALNKRAFDQLMTERVRAARRDGSALLLAYMDLDGFKAVNDAHGHSAGDRILKAFAESAMGSIRSGDAFARIGGDEFAAVLPLQSAADGDQLAQTIHRRVSRALAMDGLGVTCSMGGLIAEAHHLGTTDNYVALADKLMYEVKKSGKNALRIGRIGPIAATLRAAYLPPTDSEPFTGLLASLDRAAAEAGRRA